MKTKYEILIVIMCIITINTLNNRGLIDKKYLDNSCGDKKIQGVNKTLNGINKDPISSRVVEEDKLEPLIDNYLLSFPSFEKFNGVILIAEGNNILYNKGFGFANQELNIKNNKSTRFQIGSITKAFTSMLVLKLMEEGIIDLDNSICDYLPYYPRETGENITIQHLLTNTSGIPHHYDVVSDFFTKHDHYFHTPVELLSLFWSAPLKHDPGEEFTYSSPGYYILGAIMQQVTGKSYAELLKEYILDPLGLYDTYVENNRTTDKNLATGYQRGLMGLSKAYSEDKSTALAAGDIISTAYDLFLWQRTLTLSADKILSQESKKILFQPVFQGSPMTMVGPHFKIPYENGTKILDVSLLNGSSSGYASYIGRQTENDRCVIVLSNVNGEDVARIADDIGDIYNRQILNIFIGEEAPLTKELPVAKELDRTSYSNKIGFYKYGNGDYIGIVRDGNELFYFDFNILSGVETLMQMTPVSEDTFYISHNKSFKCVFRYDILNSGMSIITSRMGNTMNVAYSSPSLIFNYSDYTGYFTSLELQKTYYLNVENNELEFDEIFGKINSKLIYLEKDLFGFELGFVRFTRNDSQGIDGFLMFTKSTDKYFGSKFIKIVI